MIQFKSVSKRFNDKSGYVDALREVSLHVEKGDIYGVIGFSGAGKSTLIRMVNALEKPDQGEVIIDGQALHDLGKNEILKLRKRIGMIFQQFNLLESKTVYQNIAIPLILEGWKKDKIEKRVEELLQFVELEDKKNVYIRKLSGGQNQRVGIARALATNPDILLCDEATSALDPKTTESILALLKKINKELSVTILLITHQMQVVQRICNKVAVMEEGRVIEQGEVLEVFSHPKETVTREFVSTVINDRIPDAVWEAVKKEKRNGRVEKLNFVGDTIKEPVIAKLSSITGIEVNILCATVQEAQESVICFFMIHFIGSDEVIDQAEQLIDSYGVVRERMETA